MVWLKAEAPVILTLDAVKSIPNAMEKVNRNATSSWIFATRSSTRNLRVVWLPTHQRNCERSHLLNKAAYRNIILKDFLFSVWLLVRIFFYRSVTVSNFIAIEWAIPFRTH
jgi:hypothetical protein